MAGFRKNINKNIKIGLDARVKALSNYSKVSSGELRSPLLGPISDSDDYTLTYEEQTSKSPYVRMISPGTTKTQILYGTFNATLKQEVEDSFTGLSTGGDSPDFFNSVQDRIGPSDTTYYSIDPEKNTGDMSFGRPKPGITSAKVEFIKYGGAVRKATVNWVCFSLDELQMYTEGSFLSAGRNIILDWGWVRSGKGSEQVPKLLMVENNRVVLDSRLFAPQLKDTDGKIIKEKASPWDMLWKEHYGDWGGMIGIISNFSWSMNTDGSFQCVTEIMAKGASVFDQPIPSPKKEQMSELPMGQQTFDRFMVDLMKDLGDGKVDSDILAGPALNIKERCNTLDIEILTKCFSHVLKAKENMKDAVAAAQEAGDDVEAVIADLEAIVLPAVFHAEKNNIVVILRPSKSATLPASAGGDLQLLEEFDEDPDTLEYEKAVKKAGDVSTDIWIRWGWFEDNIVSYYAVERTKESDVAEAEFRSVTTADNPLTTDDDETGQLTSVVIANSENLYTIDPNVCILPGQYPTSWHQKVSDKIDPGPEKAEKEIYSTLAESINANCEDFAVNPDDWNKGGYLRNIMVNLSQIQAAFSGPGESIQSAMLKLANSLNAGVKVWNFDVDKSDPGAGPTTAVTTYFVHTPDSGPEEEDVVDDSSKPENSYIFENNGFNSIVTDINMSSTLPDKFAMMAGYGQTRAEEDSKPSAQTNPDIIRALLKDRGDTSEEAKQAKAMGEFFADPGNRQVIGPLQKTQSEYAEYGHLDGKNKIGELNLEGLASTKGSQWNHSFSDTLIALNPTSKANYAKQFESKYIDSVSAGQSQIMATVGGDIKDVKEQKDLNIMAWPSTDANDTLNKDLILEFKKPYDQNGKLRSHFVSTIKWWHEDSPLTKVGANSKTLTLPITLSMTIDGCSGLFAGNMFRLSYLPAEMYGQTDMNSGARVGSPPKSYFHMNGVSHDISATGWKTEIDATLNKYNPGNVDQENADKQVLAKWKKDNAGKLKALFAENLRKMAMPEENEATGVTT